MHILILGGNSPRHHAWIREIGDYLTSAGHAVVLHDYKHWETGQQNADIDGELDRLRDVVAGLDHYAVVAKSIGTVIATLGASRGILRPTSCVLLGIPIDGAAGKTPAFASSLSSLPPTTVIQNQHDPYGSAASLARYLAAADAPNLQLVTMPDNNTHDYLDFAQVERMLVQS